MTHNADLSGLRILAVHAHPDDEVLFTGGMLADMAARGADVRLITCTLGEEGEVIGETYQGLARADMLGGLRAGELADSCAALGIDHELLGGATHFRDSGMAGAASHANPQALVNRVEEATEVLRERIAQLDPHIIFTYGPDGGYGHPDHIAVHQATHAAAGHERRIWWAVFERTATRAALAEMTPPEGWQLPPQAYLDNFTNEGADVVYPLDETALAAKRAALAAHATQIWVADGTTSYTNPVAAHAHAGDPALAPTGYALSNLYLMPLARAEHVQAGQACPSADDLQQSSATGAAALLAGLRADD